MRLTNDVGLERRVLEEIRHHHLRVRFPLQHQLDPHVVGGHVLDVEERRQLARQDDVGDALDQGGLVDRVGDAGDEQRPAAARDRLPLPGRAKTDRAGAGPVDLLQLVGGVEDLSAGREVRALHVATELRAAEIRVVEQLDQRGAHLAEVMRRDVGGHADGNAGRAVDQQIREPRRQDDRFGLRAVVVRPERDRRLVDLFQHFVGDAREPALGVAHRGGAVAVERTEIS